MRIPGTQDNGNKKTRKWIKICSNERDLKMNRSHTKNKIPYMY